MKRTYFVLSCGVMALGVLHMAATAWLFAALTQSALWFLSAGLFMLLVGALNLLNRAYGAAAPGVRWVCVAANVVTTAFALTAGVVGKASKGEIVVVVRIIVGLSALSVRSDSVGRRPDPGAA